MFTRSITLVNLAPSSQIEWSSSDRSKAKVTVRCKFTSARWRCKFNFRDQVMKHSPLILASYPVTDHISTTIGGIANLIINVSQ